MPTRFNVDISDVENKWSFVGREKFAKLVEDFEMVLESCQYTGLWVYGTEGYGKSHLLAVVVCYLIARGKRVVYIPDCRECLNEPLSYILPSMLFAWADDETMQRKIMELNSVDDFDRLIEYRRDIVMVFDQMDGLDILDNEDKEIERYKGNLYKWLIGFRAAHKAVLGTSANNRSFRLMNLDQTSEINMRLYRGLTEVSLNDNSCFAKKTS